MWRTTGSATKLKYGNEMRGVKSGSNEVLIEVCCCSVLIVMLKSYEVVTNTMNNTVECFLYEGILSHHEVFMMKSIRSQ